MIVFIFLALLGAITLALYTAHAVKSWGGVPPSLSDTYYRLERRGFFSLALAAGVFATLPAALVASSPSWQFLIFLSLVGMLAVATAPHFRTRGEEVQRRIHMTGAVVLLVCAAAWSTIHQPWSLLWWLIPANIFAFSRYGVERCERTETTRPKSNALFWAEVAAMLQLYTTILIELWTK